MYIKRYTIAALILIALVGGFVYTYVSKDTTTIDFFGIPLPALSIAIWVIIPLVLLYIASVLHITFYSFLGTLNTRKYEKDHEKLLDLIIDAYLGKKDRSHVFKTPPYSLLGRLLDNSTIFPNGEITFKFDNEKTQKMSAVLNDINAIKNGEVVDLKVYNLNMENQLVIQNERNKYKKGELSAEDILSNSTKYAEALNKEVYADFAKVASLVNIQKYKALMTKEALFSILSRVNAEEFTLEITNEDIVELIKMVDLDTKELIKLSSTLAASGMIPDQRIKLFEILSDDNESGTEAYLYTLFDLELIDPAFEILDSSQPNEYMNFKAYRALKESHKNFSIELFI